jgi:DNA/RNA endonuclease G (NUC1)
VNAPSESYFRRLFARPARAAHHVFRRKMRFEGLEPRLLLSGDLAPSTDEFLAPEPAALVAEPQASQAVIADVLRSQAEAAARSTASSDTGFVELDAYAPLDGEAANDEEVIDFGFTALAAVAGADHLLFGNPTDAGIDPNNFLIERDQYAISYNDATKNPNWAAWQLNSTWLGGNFARKSFRADPVLADALLDANPGDSYGSTYDRGHLVPADDRRATEDDSIAVSYMTNIVPQHSNLNRGAWKVLEDFSREMVLERNNELYIYAGGYGTLLDDALAPVTFDRGDGIIVTAPAHTWKAILILPEPGDGPDDVAALDAAGLQSSLIVVDFPNEPTNGGSWDDYIISVDELESRLQGAGFAGFDLFEALPDGVEAQIEALRYAGPVDITNALALNPGGRSPHIENLTSLTVAPAQTVVIEIGGTSAGNTSSSHDQFVVSGPVQLGGRLQIVSWNGFVPSLGDSFKIIDSASITGNFQYFLGTTIGPNLAFVPRVAADGYYLDVVQASQLTTSTATELKGGGGLVKAVFEAVGEAVEYAIKLPFVKAPAGDELPEEDPEAMGLMAFAAAELDAFFAEDLGASAELLTTTSTTTTTESASIGQLADIDGAIQSTLTDSIDAAIPDANAAVLEVQTRITKFLEGLDGTEVGGFTIDVLSVIGTYDLVSPYYRVALSATREDTIELDPGSAPLLGINFTGAEVDVRASVALDLSFGLDATGQFFLQVHDFDAGVNVGVSGLGFDISLDEINASLAVQNGTMALDAKVGLSSTGQITESVLTAVVDRTTPVSSVFTPTSEGTFSASLDFSADITGFEDFELHGGGSIAVSTENVFSGDAPDITISVDGTLEAMGQTLEGGFVLHRTGSGESAQTLIHVEVDTLELTAGGTRVAHFGNGEGDFVYTSEGIAGSFSIDLLAGPNIAGLEMSGTATLHVDTTGEANVFGVSLEGSLTAFDQELEGTFDLLVVDGDDTVISVNAGITRLDLTADGWRFARLSGMGAMQISSAGVAASMSMTLVDGPDLDGVEFDGTSVMVEFNTTGASVTSIGGTAVNLVPENPGEDFYRLIVDGQLTALEQELDGVFTLQVNSGDATTVHLAVSELVYTMRAGTARVAEFTGAGELDIGAEGLWGGFEVTLAQGPEIAGMALTAASAALAFDTRAGSRFAQVNVNTGSSGLTFASGRTMRGAFALRADVREDADPIVTLQADDVAIDFGMPSVSVDNGDGTFVFTSSGFFGQASADISVTHSSLSFDGDFTVAVNTTGTHQHETVDLGSGAQTLDLAAGPYVRVSADDATLTYTPSGGSAQTLSGDFSLEASTAGGSPVVVVSAHDAGMTLSAGGEALVEVTNASGAFLITTAGIAGSLSATVEAAAGADFSLEGRFGVELNSTGAAVDLEATVGTGTISVDVEAGPFLRLSGDDVAINVRDQLIGGDFALEATSSEVRLTGSELSATLSAGGTRLTVSGGAGTLVINEDGVAGKASFGSVALTGLPQVSVSATDVAIEVRTMSGPDVTLTIDSDGDGTQESVTLAGPNPYFQVTAAQLDVEVLGQTVTGQDVGLRVVDESGHSVITLDADTISVPLSVGGSTLMTLQGGGTLRIADEGIAGFGTLTVPDGIDFGTLPLSLTSATVDFELNSTGEAVTVTPLDGDPAEVVDAGEYLKLMISGGLQIGDEFVIDGSFVATLEESQATLELMSLTAGDFTLEGDDPLITVRFFREGTAAVDYEVMVGYSLVVSGLQGIVEFVTDSLEGNEYFNQPIPVINRSLADAVDFIDDFAERVERAGQVAPDALGAVELAIEEALGLPASALEIDFDLETMALVVDFEWTRSFSEDVQFSFDLASLAGMDGLDLSALGDLDILGDRLALDTQGNLHLGAQVTLDAAVELSLLPLATGGAPVAKLRRYDETTGKGTRLQVGAQVLGTDLSLAFDIGPISAGVTGGRVAFDGDGNAATTSDMATFTVAFTEDYEVGDPIGDALEFDVQGRMSVDLPLAIVNGDATLPLGSFSVSTNPAFGANGLEELYNFFVNGATSSGADPVVIDFPDVVGTFERLFGEFSLLAMLNDPSFLLEGIDFLLGTVSDVLDSGWAADLPLVGDDLAAMGDFVSGIRTGLLEDLQQYFDETTPIEAIRDVLWGVLRSGSGGLGILRDSNGDGAVDISDIGIKWRRENGTVIQAWEPGQTVPVDADSLQFDLKLGGNIFSEGFDIPLDLDLPGFGLDVDGGLSAVMEWYFDLGFGISLSDGFYVATKDEAEIGVEISAFLDGDTSTPDVPDPFSASGSFLFFDVTADDGGTPSTLEGALTLDLDGGADRRLTLDEALSRPGSAFDLDLTVDADVTLGLTLEVNKGLEIDTAAGERQASLLPKLKGDLDLDWHWELGEAVTAPSIGLDNLRIELGSAVADFLLPIAAQIRDTLRPI